MGPNSIAAIVTEQAQSGTKSLKLGASDWAYDKTAANELVSKSSFPANSQARFLSHIWISDAANYNSNFVEFFVGGEELRYQSNKWLYESSVTPFVFSLLGSYPLTADSWHTVNATVDLSSNTWVSLAIDGTTPFNVKGLPAPALARNTGGYQFDFGVFPAKTNQSIYACNKKSSLCTGRQSTPTVGFYAYLDNVEIDYITKQLPISDTNNTVVTINGVNYGAQQLPYAPWFNGGETISYNFGSLIQSTGTKHYVWNNQGPPQTGTFTVTGPASITGLYTAQYLVNFGFLDSSKTINLTQPTTFAVMDSNGSTFVNPGTAWFDAGLTQLTSVSWEGSNVLPTPSPFVDLFTGGQTFYFSLNVYKRTFTFTYSDRKTIFTPAQMTFTAPNGTSVIVPSATSYANILIQGGSSQVTGISYWGNNVAINPNQVFDASNSSWGGKVVASIFPVTPVWEDSNLNALAIPPASYKIMAPNGTLLGPLISGTSYWMQNGTSTVSAVMWEGTDVTASNSFDAVNGSPTIPLSIFSLKLDQVDTSGNPLMVNVQLTLPNGTVVTLTPVAGWTNLTQVQIGYVSIVTPIPINATSQYVLQSPSTITVTSNVVQTETWEAKPI